MSPAATHTGVDAQRAILDAADKLFYDLGIAGVGMTEIRDAAGVSLRRLYSLYPSKRCLVAGWLSDRHLRWMEWFLTTVEKRSAGGVDPLLATFDALDEWVTSPSYRGCAFLNSIAERGQIDGTHWDIIADHKRQLVAHLAGLATQNHPGCQPWLPSAIGVLIDGAIVQSAVFHNATPVAVARIAAQHLIGASS